MHQFYDNNYDDLKGQQEASLSLRWDITCGDTQSGINTFLWAVLQICKSRT